MHPIQNFIILQLSENDSLRYSDIKPRSMEAAQFMYHLKQLSAAGFVTKLGNLYSLTPLGVQYVDRFNEQDLSPFSYPRIAIALIYDSPTKGILLSRRYRQPGIGKAGFILVDVPLDYGPPLERLATEAFRAMTGISSNFKHRADGYIRVLSQTELLANMLAHVFVGQGEEFKVPSEFVWQADMDRSDIFASTWLVLDDLAAKNYHFFFEHTVETAIPR